ncbi:hypothetical protein DPMN_174261 [Dreissena polymorpha]|uniref:Uncharacterized protein n=1 Tax=Dreissena polymorpha TaxID=45954 RepID=A0A9D4IEY9_DREPO|nr:hypothetical protein DPMN_174228 [Dreissena polymorpha]KAH3772914.1 hypothetical protein DPMN_174261 [Dreissena polymorpha]
MLQGVSVFIEIYERSRDWLRAASEARRSSHELPEPNLALARICSDLVDGNSHGIYCHNKNVTRAHLALKFGYCYKED